MTQTLSFALCVLALSGCVYSPEKVRIVNASGERLADVDISVSGRAWHLSDIGHGDVRKLDYRAGWFEPEYNIHIVYEDGETYSISHSDSTLDSATFIIRKQAYELTYSEIAE